MRCGPGGQGCSVPSSAVSRCSCKLRLPRFSRASTIVRAGGVLARIRRRFAPVKIQWRDGVVGDDKHPLAAHVALQQLRVPQQVGADVDGVRPLAQVHVNL